jgi:hypothetical protein
MSKGMSIAAATVLFTVSAFLTTGIIAGGFDILENNVVEKRLMTYSAKDFAITLGVLADSDRRLEMEKEFDQEYDFTFEDSGTGENLTMSRDHPEPITVEVEVPTMYDLPEQSYTGDTLCVVRNPPPAYGNPVSISSGPC